MSYNPVPKLTNGNATFNKDVNVSGILNAGSGVVLVDLVPASTTNALYNDGGTLKFNGSGISGGGSSLTVKDVDGSPSVSNVSTIRVTNGSLTDNGGGTVTIATSGGGGGGSADLQTVTDYGSSTTNAITITNNNITASSGLFDSLDMTPLAEADYPVHQEGVVFYDVENHTLSLYNDEADVTLQLGQEEFLRVRNNTGATIVNGTVVLINGAHGNAAPTISGAIATSEANSQIVGLTTHDIEDSSFGYVTTYGIVRDVDTSQFSDGDEIFLSATQIGSGVNVSPTIPNYKVTVGHVIRSHDSNGSILVQVGHPKLGGGDLKSEVALNMSGVPFVTSISDTTAGGSQTDPLFIFDSGNRQLQLGSGVQLLDGVPSNTSNVLYNNGGTLYFDGSTIGGGGGGSYTAGSGLTLVGNEFNVHGGSGNFVELDVEGAFTATTKSFLIDHPSKEGMKLQYGSLEGPENGVYTRGRTSSHTIYLPDYWIDLVDQDTITVNLTPIGWSATPRVRKVVNNTVKIFSLDEGDLDYYYIVHAERKDVPKLEVEW